jgi:hypothetical protein
MTSRALAMVLLGVLGVYFLGSAITEVGTAVFFLNLDSTEEWLQQSHRDQALTTAVWVILQVGLAVCLLLLRTRIASALCANEPDGGPGAIEPKDLQAALFAGIGVYFSVKALAVLAGGVARLTPLDSLSVLWPSYASSMAEAVFGVALFFGSRSLAGVWHLPHRDGNTG